MQVRGAAMVAAAIVLVGGLLGGCSGGDDEPAATPAPSTPAPSASAAPGDVTCTDKAGDSVDPSLDLLAVRLARTGKNVRVIFDSTEVPEKDPVSWVAGFVSADGKHTVELTAERRRNGDFAHAIVVDGEEDGVDDVVRLTAEGMTTVFPVKAIDALGAGVRWYAVVSVNGDDIDLCPGDVELREVLDIVPLTLPAGW
ncbi:hypothetical protein [Sporichthya sp.]|uniref:hypothetical protein n=1 Tax=Sporichthya sp. TaxID=65475 RepID=UPI0017B0CB70|nr:hypothetical protein [Sporichthya sp.]MBA3743904.1 hypothetical protein [Sporichthya sp.]